MCNKLLQRKGVGPYGAPYFCTFRYHNFYSLKLVIWLAVLHEGFIGMILLSQKIFDSLCYPWCLARFNRFNLVGNEVRIYVQKDFV